MSGEQAIHKPWETKFSGYPVYQRDPILALHAGKFIYTLVPSQSTELIKNLEEDGYRVLVPTITLELENITIPFIIDRHIRKASKDDESQLRDIAFFSFRNSRLHASFGNTIADDMHSDWISNCLKGEQADSVLVYEIDGIVCGFIALRINDHIGEIVLIAVDSKYREKGIGLSLVCAACNEMQKSISKIRVRTELPNISAIRMYEKCGFRTTTCSIYMGKWTQ